MSNLWEKEGHVDSWVIRFTVGDDYKWDQTLLPYDVEATLAHVRGLGSVGILTDKEVDDIGKALDALLDDYAKGLITVEPEDEDCHTVIENYLTLQLGDTGKKVHTGRSRNDQVLAALRLYLRDELARVIESAGLLCAELIGLVEEKDDWILPGYTHTRQAMPSTVGAWAAGFAELLVSDVEGLLHARRRVNLCPLGSAAGYGVPYLRLPRKETSESLGFDGLQHHVTSVQLSRSKFEMEVVHALAQLSLTLNRLASDLILYSSSEFGFVTLATRHTTGSSIMPQKQNPDVLELVRASYHRVCAELNLLTSLSANLTSGYHRDLQLAKEAVIRALTLVSDCVLAMTTVTSSVDFDRARMESTLRSDTLSTHAAMQLTLEGTPFRESYRAAGKGDVPTMSIEDAVSAYVDSGYPGVSNPRWLKKRVKELLAQI